MSVTAALQEMFAVPELTVPVALGAASVRGYLDDGSELVAFAGAELQHDGPVLFLRKDSLAGLQQNVTVVVGTLGAASAVGGRNYRVHKLIPVEDGLIQACTLGGGR